jgi:hypothetical protein
LLEEARRVLLGHREGELMEVPNVWGPLTLQTYSRVRSHLESVVLLVDAGFPEEGLQLARTLLSDSLLLMELAARPSDRMALAFAYYSESITERENLGRTAKAVDLARADEWAPAIAKQRLTLQEGMQRHGVSKLERVRGETSLARTHDRLDEVWNHRFMSTMLHRVDVAQTFRRRDAEGSTALYMHNRDPRWAAVVLAAAMTSALHAHAATAHMLKWDEPGADEAHRLIREVEVVFPDDGARSS